MEDTVPVPPSLWDEILDALANAGEDSLLARIENHFDGAPT